MAKRKNATLHQTTKGSLTPSRKTLKQTPREKTAKTSGFGASRNIIVVVALILVFGALIFLTGNFSFGQNINSTESTSQVDEMEDEVLSNEEQDQNKIKTHKQPGPPGPRKKVMDKQAQKGDMPTEVPVPRTEVVPAKKQDNEEFKENFLTQISIKTMGLPVSAEELTHSNERSSVKAYLITGLLRPYECDQLIKVHKKHTEEATLDPILCFSDIGTLRKHLKYAKKNVKVSEKDFTLGTKCLNESLSVSLKRHFKWSYSTAFYPGESKFSSMYADRIEKVTGMPPQNGGKFQITSYPNGVAYKNHTDCIVGSLEKRDRFATILVYLQDVEKGGETHFPELGIKVKPQKGHALVWNSMDPDGNCDQTSIHNSSHVEVGHKYIIQRWYYYKSFPSLGKRVPEPQLPHRKPHQPRVMCDEFEFGSCRWYDEWNYDHLTEYPYR